MASVLQLEDWFYLFKLFDYLAPTEMFKLFKTVSRSSLANSFKSQNEIYVSLSRRTT